MVTDDLGEALGLTYCHGDVPLPVNDDPFSMQDEQRKMPHLFDWTSMRG